MSDRSGWWCIDDSNESQNVDHQVRSPLNFLGANFGNLTLVACPTIELAGEPKSGAQGKVVSVDAINVLKELMSGRGRME